MLQLFFSHARSVREMLPLVQTEIALLDGFPSNFVQTFMVPRRWFLITWWSSDFSSSATMKFTFVVLSEMFTIGWTATKLNTDTYVFLRMNSNDFGDFLTFPPAPSSGQNFSLSNTLVYTEAQCRHLRKKCSPCFSEWTRLSSQNSKKSFHGKKICSWFFLN